MSADATTPDTSVIDDRCSASSLLARNPGHRVGITGSATVVARRGHSDPFVSGERGSPSRPGTALEAVPSKINTPIDRTKGCKQVLSGES
jgi:hypothetical protein